MCSAQISSPRTVSEDQVLASLLRDVGSSELLSQCCMKSASLPTGIPWFGKRGTIRNASLHPDPLGKTNFFVLSENIWEPGIGTRDLSQENTKVGISPP